MENKENATFDDMSIGAEIRKIRREKDITQKELSEIVKNLDIGPGVEIKLSQREISQLENGTGNPTMNKLEAIAIALEMVWKLK